MRLYRELKLNDHGEDVSGAKRAVYKLLSREDGKLWKFYLDQSPLAKAFFGETFEQHLEIAKHHLAVKRDKKKVFGQHTFDALQKAKAVDQKVIDLLASARPPQPTKEELIFDKLFASMKQMSDHTPGYRFGGGHGVPLYRVSSYQGLDCSSSTSKALYDAGIFPHTYAWVSGDFARSFGQPGTGKLFTIYANWEHVWIRLYKGNYWRFDTSPHGDGGRGPKLRKLPRFSSTFTARHYPGL
jgi:hypothetical protein